MSQSSPVFVHLLPAMIPTGALKGGVAVVIDVLRATTVMIHALAAGCDAVIPCLEIDEAREIAARLPPGSTVLAGEREARPIEGFDLGNSPASFTPEICSGRTVVMTTTNGTRGILSCLDADRVFIGAFVNRKATVDALASDGRPIHIVCSGTDGLVSLEDSMLAGAFAQDLDTRAWEDSGGLPFTSGDEGTDQTDTVLANDSAEIAAALWRETESISEEGYSLADSMGDGRGGRRVFSLGLELDIADAARVDRFPFAAELMRDPIRIVPASNSGPRLRLVGL